MDLEMVQIDPNIEHWNFVSPGNSDRGGPRKHVHTLPTIITSHKRISTQDHHNIRGTRRSILGSDGLMLNPCSNTTLRLLQDHSKTAPRPL